MKLPKGIRPPGAPGVLLPGMDSGFRRNDICCNVIPDTAPEGLPKVIRDLAVSAETRTPAFPGLALSVKKNEGLSALEAGGRKLC